MKSLIKIVNEFKGKKIGVIGDLMLDQFILGKQQRISPEALAPIVLVEKEIFALGGAGNAANNIAALGGEVFVLGIIGADRAGERLLEELKIKNINIRGIIKVDKPTTQKIRIIAGNRQIVRVDKEDVSFIKKKIEKKIYDFVASRIKNWDALIISDYLKGVVTKDLAKKLIYLARKNQKPIIADTKSKDISYLKGATVFTPNLKEAVAIIKTQNIRIIGRKIQRKIDSSVLITQGRDGMTLFENNKIKHFRAQAKKTLNASGGGDTVVSVLALGLGSGLSLEESTIIANYAAAVVVNKPETAAVSPSELKKIIEQ